jgi:hypothetical protein
VTGPRRWSTATIREPWISTTALASVPPVPSSNRAARIVTDDPAGAWPAGGASAAARPAAATRIANVVVAGAMGMAPSIAPRAA